MKALSHSAIAKELCSLAGLATRGHKPLEDLLDSAIDKLLASGKPADSHLAEITYAKYASACQGFRAIGGNPDDNHQLAGVGQYTRESAAGIPSVTRIGKAYHAPKGPALAPIASQSVVGPTAKQQAARREFATTFATKGAGSRLSRKFA